MDDTQQAGVIFKALFDPAIWRGERAGSWAVGGVNVSKTRTYHKKKPITFTSTDSAAAEVGGWRYFK